MVAIGLLLILTFIVACAGGVGFLIGYFVGRRSGAKERQVGFPILPTESPAEMRSPTEAAGPG